MMRQQTKPQECLLYGFRLDDWVPVDHLLRKIDAVLDLSGLRRPSGDYARKRTSIWRIDGFADWGSKAQFQIIRPSQFETAKADFRAGRCSTSCIKVL
jgi:hypothetical protein